MNKIIACNWKMNMGLSQIAEYFEYISQNIDGFKNKNVILFPAFIHLVPVLQILFNKDVDFIKIGSQDVSQFALGAYTGDVSCQMLTDIGVTNCLIGHSERRNIFMDSNEIISRKIAMVLDSSINPFFCIGETLEELENNQFESVIKGQLSVLDDVEPTKLQNITIAYEPVWAIGTGKIPSQAQIKQKHQYIKNLLLDKYGINFKILYGGSVNEANFNEILNINTVDGVLIGGASLKPNNLELFCS